MNGLALCSGIAGIELGLCLAEPGHRTVCYVEQQAHAAAVVVARMEEASIHPAPVWDDLETFDGRPWRHAVDIVTAGFPCQPFSSAGKKLGKRDHRWLWPSVDRIIGEVEPAFVFLENVQGFVRRGLGDVLGGLAERGFSAEWDVFSAAGVGAPHLRRRFFLLAAHPDREPVRDEEQRLPRGWPGFVRDQGEPVAVEDGFDGEAADSDGGGREKQRLEEPAWLFGQAGDQSYGRRCPWFVEDWQAGVRKGHVPEPAIRRVADGNTDRMDRLRALGNAVVPAVAARAYTILKGRLGR